MISIDTVYQKVLAFANKEQRGYITPQEFNLFADQAQKEIFEQYFYDLNQSRRVLGNNTGYADMTNNLEEKISLFEIYDKIVSVVGQYGDVNLNVDIPNLYRLTMVRVDYKKQSTFKVAEETQLTELNTYGSSPLATWSQKRPVYTRYGTNSGNDRLKVYPYPSSDASVDKVLISYIRKPEKPSWGYVVVNGNAMYDPSNKADFELHESEETELVYKILKFAGLSMRRDDLAKGGQGLETLQTNQEKQ